MGLIVESFTSADYKQSVNDNLFPLSLVIITGRTIVLRDETSLTSAYFLFHCQTNFLAYIYIFFGDQTLLRGDQKILFSRHLVPTEKS